MPWESRTVEDQRREFAQAAQNCSNFSALCREYGITRRTGTKWKQRYACGELLCDRSRRPHTTPMRTSQETENLILAVRAENPGWGAKTIHSVLTRQGHHDLPCVKTVNNILHRYGCISLEESLKHQPFIRFEKEHCNEMWQTDFKGEFRMADAKYCYTLTILDDRSRFCIAAEPRLSTANLVIPTFRDVFRVYGMPDSILSDNGAQFAGFKNGFTLFERWLMDYDILPIHGRIKHPQTQGKIERFHRTMKHELLNHVTFENIDDAKLQLAAWREKYNCVRPHEALGMHTPAEIYTPSHRIYQEIPPVFEYGGEFPVIKVNNWGYVRFAGFQVYLSETLANHHLEFRPSPNDDSFFACYRNFKIAQFDANDGHLIHRSISRL